MAENTTSKLGLWLGIGASLAAIISAVIYVKSTRGQRGGGQPAGRRRIQQPNRDRRLGRVQNKRKFFGYFGQSSGQGAGAAANPIPAISRLGKGNIQRPRVYHGGTTPAVQQNAATAPWRIRRLPRGTGPTV